MNILRIMRHILDSFKKSNPRIKLLTMMPKNSVCAEVGVWKGDFSEKILEIVKPKKLYLIDPWKFRGDGDYQKSLYGSNLAKDQENMDKIYLSVKEKFETQIASGQVIILRGPSQELLNTIDAKSLDWIYIDGDHTYEAVKNDLSLSIIKVKRNGLITGDDYGTRGWWKGGVQKAVDECIRSASVKKIKIIIDQFILRNL